MCHSLLTESFIRLYLPKHSTVLSAVTHRHTWRAIAREYMQLSVISFFTYLSPFSFIIDNQHAVTPLQFPILTTCLVSLHRRYTIAKEIRHANTWTIWFSLIHFLERWWQLRKIQSSTYSNMLTYTHIFWLFFRYIHTFTQILRHLCDSMAKAVLVTYLIGKTNCFMQDLDHFHSYLFVFV
jgi:hypothetical protein